MTKATDWIRRNDPLGATVKGVIVAVFGIAAIASGGSGVGWTFLALGLLLFALPFWLSGRGRRPRDRWGARR
ncbi:MAG: hypothetical protein JWM47_2588 [Acidimicrobiales bacterium]|nr:hypothetical protein [Acidimicrobiales bacterium]